MNFERFSQLWDEHVGDLQKESEITLTLQVLIDYSNGDKSKIETIRKSLGR